MEHCLKETIITDVIFQKSIYLQNQLLRIMTKTAKQHEHLQEADVKAGTMMAHLPESQI